MHNEGEKTPVIGGNMSDLSDFADQLHTDVISDMAESFFGGRKELDNALEAYSSMVKELLPVIEHMFQAAATLRLLLLDDAGADAFCVELGIDPSRIPQAEGAPILVRESLPFSMTGGGRYNDCVTLAYQGLHEAIREYLHGRHYDDPDQSGRKRLTMHYRRLKEIAEIINEKIHKANNERSVSTVLREVKRLDPVQMEREEMLGDVVYGDGCGKDPDMCFVPIDFDGYQFPEVEELPSPKEVKPAVKRFCSRLYAERKDAVREAIDVFTGR
jgi:hypothetical protein